MHKTILLPADSFTVVSRTVMNDNDRLILTMLYQPLINYKALSLYNTLWALLDKTETMSIEFTHRHLINMTGLKIEDIIEGRKKLEAVGLLKTALKTLENNNYIYQLYAPLSAYEFLKQPLLNSLLYSSLGSKEYNRVVKYFKIPNLKINDYKDITASFSDVFKTGTVFDVEKEKDIRKRENCEIELKVDLDIDFIISSLPKGITTPKTFDKETCNLLKGLIYLYNIDNNGLIQIIRNSLNEKGLIDKEKLQNNARSYYQFENNNHLPHLIYNKQPSKLRKKTSDGSKRSKMIYTFETLSPYDFLRGKYGGSNPTTRDLKMVEGLMLNQELPPGVVNVLIDYVLKINDNKLNKNFVETIAGQWKRLKIKTVEEAMKQAEKEHKGYKNKTTAVTSKKIIEDVVPEWFDKKIDAKEATLEEEEKMKAMLSEFM